MIIEFSSLFGSFYLGSFRLKNLKNERPGIGFVQKRGFNVSHQTNEMVLRILVGTARILVTWFSKNSKFRDY
jgi:hypothetical protein